jgi:DNA-binding transcriptional regulator/RsmH inhibitor MraZ
MGEDFFYSKCPIEESGLIELPRKWLDSVDVSDGVVIIPHIPSPLPDYLAADIWPNTDEYEVHLEQIDSLYHSKSKRTRDSLRGIYGSITYEAVDEEGRVVIAKPVRELSRLAGEVVRVELVDHIELWNTEVWESRMNTFNDLLTDFFP